MLRVLAPAAFASVLVLVVVAPSDAVFATDRGQVANRRARATAAARVLDAPFFTQGRGMHLSPMLAKIYHPGRGGLSSIIPMSAYLQDQLGVLFDRKRPIGIHQRTVQGVPVTVASCMSCHTGRAAGRTIVGLGNKTIDTGAISELTLQIRAMTGAYAALRGPAAVALHQRSVRFARNVTDPRWMNETWGMISGFTALKWAYDAVGVSVENPPRLGSKTSHLWGYAEKARVGQFCDGRGKGLGWMAVQEISAGQHLETAMAYQDKLQHFVNLTNDLLPPRYPFAIHHERAARGAAVFEENCARCHGTYERDTHGFPIYQSPRMIPIEMVRTDPERLDLYKTEEFLEGLSKSPLAQFLASNPARIGYFAPRLDGVWARFPYLHNASVPTLWHLLKPASQRPRAWSLEDAGERSRFNAHNVGLSLPVTARGHRRLENQGRRGKRSVYWVERAGHSNRGHPFGTRLADPDKRALIEYLKTL